jgi:hypothetical protein
MRGGGGCGEVEVSVSVHLVSDILTYESPLANFLPPTQILPEKKRWRTKYTQLIGEIFDFFASEREREKGIDLDQS